ncbi:hypothetical protein MTR67_023553 [Solanum verrucosum]|uniref:Uncharacterized protein n=1 Tax=Solanum verrucosum TaxID=315347 RepID=A0AAF0QXC3_SOLVR|nr:hypothetical protein MTR67_023553 [Solanum verrucosum]
MLDSLTPNYVLEESTNTRHGATEIRGTTYSNDNGQTSSGNWECKQLIINYKPGNYSNARRESHHSGNPINEDLTMEL